MRKKRVVLILLVLVLLFAMIVLFVPGYLSYQKKLSARTLVVEGWMPFAGLQHAYDEFISGNYEKMLITGSMFSESITLYINSFLIFHPQLGHHHQAGSNQHSIEIHAESSLGRTDSALFVLWINNLPVAEYRSHENDGFFKFMWEGDITDIDSLMIQFKNDDVGLEGDRNLLIHKVSVNDNSLINTETSRFVDKGRPFGRDRLNILAESYAQLASHYFVSRGIDEEKIIAVSNRYPKKRRTYGNALSLKDWMLENDFASTAINVISTDYHSRRTWLVYNSILGDFTNVGVISVPDSNMQATWQSRYAYAARETIALIYYMLFILPWI